jgi:hypothetical protein
MAELEGRLTDALATFEADQDQVELAAFDAGLHPKEAPHQKREGVVQALCAVLDHLKPRLNQYSLLRPLQELLGALVDIDDGKTNPLLARREGTAPGRKQGGLIERSMRLANASAAVTLMIEGGANLDRAAAQVANRLGMPDVGAKKLKGWRKELLYRRKRDDARHLYLRILSHAEKHMADGGTRADAIERVLVSLGKGN